MYKGYFRQGHFNPATSLACAMLKQIDWLTAAYYAVGQFAGGILGSLLLWLCWFSLVPTGSQLGATVINQDTSVWQALACEMVLSFVFHTVLLGFYTVNNDQQATKSTNNNNQSDPNNNPENGQAEESKETDTEGNGRLGEQLVTLESFLMEHDTGMMSLHVTFVLLICFMIGLTVSGGSLNPARSFGPAVISGMWKDHWIFWLGPLSGAALAALLVGTLKQRE